MKRIFNTLQAQNWQCVCGAASSSLHLLWPLSGFMSISLVLSCFRLLLWTFPSTFELCVSLWAECALQNSGTSSSNSVASGKNWTSNLVGNTEFWQGAPWKSTPLSRTMSRVLNKPNSSFLMPGVVILLSSLFLSLRTMNLQLLQVHCSGFPSKGNASLCSRGHCLLTFLVSLITLWNFTSHFNI